MIAPEDTPQIASGVKPLLQQFVEELPR